MPTFPGPTTLNRIRAAFLARFLRSLGCFDRLECGMGRLGVDFLLDTRDGMRIQPYPPQRSPYRAAFLPVGDRARKRMGAFTFLSIFLNSAGRSAIGFGFPRPTVLRETRSPPFLGESSGGRPSILDSLGGDSLMVSWRKSPSS